MIYKKNMLPAGPLMKEHRLIERIIKPMEKKIQQMERTKQADIPFIEGIVDFLRTYADRCHHGKEEDVLFSRLDKKPISDKHRQIMQSLLGEHVYARKTVIALAAAKEKYKAKDPGALKEIIERMKDLALLYPKHIETEDKHFFLP